MSFLYDPRGASDLCEHKGAGCVQLLGPGWFSQWSEALRAELGAHIPLPSRLGLLPREGCGPQPGVE